MLSDRLQPCPFCGSDTRLNKWSKRIGKACPHVLKTAQVKCKKKSCGMSGPLFKGDECNVKAQAHWAGCKFDRTLMRYTPAPRAHERNE